LKFSESLRRESQMDTTAFILYPFVRPEDGRKLPFGNERRFATVFVGGMMERRER